jgi:hypothetical protein
LNIKQAINKKLYKFFKRKMEENQPPPRVIVLDENESEKDKKDEVEAFKAVGLSISLAIGDAVDVTRSEKGYADILKSVKEECEKGLSIDLGAAFVSEGSEGGNGGKGDEQEKEKDKQDADQQQDNDKDKDADTDQDEDKSVWSFLLKPQEAILSSINKKCSALGNITILFRGRAEDGILAIVDSAYLTFNDRVIDIASMAPNQDDKRVATFRGFPESNPFMFSCMSETDKLKIYIRFKKVPRTMGFGKEMIRILADLFCFESQDNFLHQSWIVPLKFDESQEFFYDCSQIPAVLRLQGELGAPPDVLSRRASRGWPHRMLFSSVSESGSESDSSSSSEQENVERELKMKEKWQERLKAEENEKKSRERAKNIISTMSSALHLRGRAYSDEDVFHIQRLFGASQGLSSEAEALCAIEIARWKAQKQLLEDELARLNV